MQVWVRTGATALDGLDTRVDELHRATATPVTSRRAWLECWLDSYPGWEPLIVGIEAPDGSLSALGALAVRRVRGLRRIVAIGDGPSDTITLPARDDRSSQALAERLREHLDRGPGPWRLVLRHLVSHDLVAPHLVATLPHARLVPGDVSPSLNASSGASLQAYISSNHRRGVSRLRNRITREGLALEVRHLRSAHDIHEVMPEVERVCRSRDLDVGRISALDVPGDREFFRTVIARHAQLDQVRLTTVTLDGQLAAYVLCFADGTVSRMWNCRFDPAFARYSPGRIAMDESVAEALAGGATVYDFMRGQEPYKTSYANSASTAQDLYAASGRVVAAGDALYLAARKRIREADDAGGRSQRVVAALRRARQRQARPSNRT